MSRSGQKQMITILRRVSIILDFLCKAMGVIVSYFEIVQNRNPDYGEKDRGHSCLMMTMTKTHRRVAGIWQKKTIYLLGRLPIVLRWNRS